MVDSLENRFKRDLYAKYEQTKKNFIPKDLYFEMIENIKTAEQSKSRHLYYLC